MLVGNRVGVDLTKGASKRRQHGGKPPAMRTGQHQWLRPGWTILATAPT